jgi:hypothetical protein
VREEISKTTISSHRTRSRPCVRTGTRGNEHRNCKKQEDSTWATVVSVRADNKSNIIRNCGKKRGSRKGWDMVQSCEAEREERRPSAAAGRKLSTTTIDAPRDEQKARESGGEEKSKETMTIRNCGKRIIHDEQQWHGRAEGGSRTRKMTIRGCGKKTKNEARR